jgi:hypothetical protein
MLHRELYGSWLINFGKCLCECCMSFRTKCLCKCYMVSNMEDSLKLSTSENVYVNVTWYSKRNVHVNVTHAELFGRWLELINFCKCFVYVNVT